MPLMLMKKFTILSVLFPCALALAACTPKAPPATPPNPTDASLAEASWSVSRSISSLSETAQAVRPMPVIAPPPDPASYGMAGLTSIDWSGPVEPLVKEMAKATGYKFHVLGREPAIPVMVSVYRQNVPIADILRDVGFQCARRATIAVYPEAQIIELRYARN